MFSTLYKTTDLDMDIEKYRNAYNNIILSENFFISRNLTKYYKAPNIAVFGCSGAGKSRHHILPNILQMNASYVIHDPNGLYYENTASALRDNGYDVFVISTYSDNKFSSNKADEVDFTQLNCKKTAVFLITKEGFSDSVAVTMNKIIDTITEPENTDKWKDKECLQLPTGECLYIEGRNLEDLKDARLSDNNTDILDANGEFITKRATKELAKEYINNLKKAEIIKLGHCGSTYTPVPIHLMLDDFYVFNIPDFEHKIAVLRVMNISATIVLQSVIQLKEKYPDTYDIILNNCPFKILLSGENDKETCEFISKMTKTDHLAITPEEVSIIDGNKELITIYGDYPIIDYKFMTRKHKYYKMTEEYKTKESSEDLTKGA